MGSGRGPTTDPERLLLARRGPGRCGSPPIWRCQWSRQAPPPGRRLWGWSYPGVGLHHHGVERLVNPAARLEPDGEEAALPQLGDGQTEIAHLGGGQMLAVAVAVAVAVGGALIRTALMELSAGKVAKPRL